MRLRPDRRVRTRPLASPRRPTLLLTQQPSPQVALSAGALDYNSQAGLDGGWARTYYERALEISAPANRQVDESTFGPWDVDETEDTPARRRARDRAERRARREARQP